MGPIDVRLNDVLRSAAGPNNARHVRRFSPPQAEMRYAGLYEPALAEGSGPQFNRAANAISIDAAALVGPVGGEQFHSQPVILVAPFIVVKHDPIGLGDCQVEVAVAVEIARIASAERLSCSRNQRGRGNELPVAAAVNVDRRLVPAQQVQAAVVIVVPDLHAVAGRVGQLRSRSLGGRSLAVRFGARHVQARGASNGQSPRTIAVGIQDRNRCCARQRGKLVSERSPSKPPVPQVLQPARRLVAWSGQDEVQITVAVPIHRRECASVQPG
jgi:hypothetical protein